MSDSSGSTGQPMLWSIITAQDQAVRDRSLDAFCRDASTEQLLAEIADLEERRRTASNLYEKVRALFFLYAIHRFHLPARTDRPTRGRIPFEGNEKLLRR